MKYPFISFSAALLILTSCESKAGTGALVGTGIGMGAGALISPTPQGVLIGGAVGAISGAAIGAALDSSDRENIEQRSPDTLNRIDNHESLSVEDIIKMHKAGISDDKIISTIDSTGSVFDLSSEDLKELKNAGVSHKVIQYMRQTAE